MRDVITKEVLERARDYGKLHNVMPVAFIVGATEERAKEIAALFGVEWQPDENGTMVVGDYHIMTGPLFKEGQ
jgi:hypothetical protein